MERDKIKGKQRVIDYLKVFFRIAFLCLITTSANAFYEDDQDELWFLNESLNKNSEEESITQTDDSPVSAPLTRELPRVSSSTQAFSVHEGLLGSLLKSLIPGLSDSDVQMAVSQGKSTITPDVPYTSQSKAAVARGIVVQDITFFLMQSSVMSHYGPLYDSPYILRKGQIVSLYKDVSKKAMRAYGLRGVPRNIPKEATYEVQAWIEDRYRRGFVRGKDLIILSEAEEVAVENVRYPPYEHQAKAVEHSKLYDKPEQQETGRRISVTDGDNQFQTVRRTKKGDWFLIKHWSDSWQYWISGWVPSQMVRIIGEDSNNEHARRTEEVWQQTLASSPSLQKKVKEQQFEDCTFSFTKQPINEHIPVWYVNERVVMRVKPHDTCKESYILKQGDRALFIAKYQKDSGVKQWREFAILRDGYVVTGWLPSKSWKKPKMHSMYALPTNISPSVKLAALKDSISALDQRVLPNGATMSFSLWNQRWSTKQFPPGTQVDILTSNTDHFLVQARSNNKRYTGWVRKNVVKSFGEIEQRRQEHLMRLAQKEKQWEMWRMSVFIGIPLYIVTSLFIPWYRKLLVRVVDLGIYGELSSGFKLFITVIFFVSAVTLLGLGGHVFGSFREGDETITTVLSLISAPVIAISPALLWMAWFVVSTPSTSETKRHFIKKEDKKVSQNIRHRAPSISAEEHQIFNKILQKMGTTEFESQAQTRRLEAVKEMLKEQELAHRAHSSAWESRDITAFYKEFEEFLQRHHPEKYQRIFG